MVSTRRVVSLHTPEEKIAHLALKPKNDLLAWVEGRRNVHLGQLNEAESWNSSMFFHQQTPFFSLISPFIPSGWG